MRSFVEGARFHVGVIVVGALFLLAGAFHGHVWFDESYSVGIANHSFADIWAIGAGDVHPVLFYWALHALNLAFGQNILVYRLFALAASVLLGVVGFTHVRRDFGALPGLLFSFFALFAPYVADMSIEIRMYSWAVLCVSLCAIYAWRAFCCVRAGGDDSGVRARAAALPRWAGVPRRWWLAFFAASLASAYLHYFGAISAFVVNALLFAYLAVRAGVARVRGARARAAAARGVRLGSPGAEDGPGGGIGRADGRDGAVGSMGGPGGAVGCQDAQSGRSSACGDAPRALAVLLAGAIVQIALYAPWLFALESQLSVVSNTYWANFTFPTTLIELGTYPVLTSALSFAQRGSYGTAAQAAADVCTGVFALAAVALLVLLAARGVRAAFAVRTEGVRPSVRRLGAWARSAGVLACALGFAGYLAVFVVADVASRVADSFLLYYRYLFVAFGMLVLGASLLTARAARSRTGAVVAALLCAALLGASAVNQVLSVSDNYSAQNDAPLEAFDEAVAWANDAPFSYAASGSATDAGTPAAEASQAPDADVPCAYERNADFAPTVDAPLVLSSDIGIQGVTAVMRPAVAQTYMDWQPGNWALSYRAYAPTLASVKTWEVALDGYEGRFVVLAQGQDGSVPRTVTDLAQKPGVEVVGVQTFCRPYERTYFTVATMEKTEA